MFTWYVESFRLLLGRSGTYAPNTSTSSEAEILLASSPSAPARPAGGDEGEEVRVEEINSEQSSTEQVHVRTCSRILAKVCIVHCMYL